MREEELSIDTDPALLPLQTSQAAFLPPVFTIQAGQLASISGQVGPNITLNTAAPLNGVAITIGAAANTITFGLSGIGTLAQRNAIAAVADIATADATDLPTVITLANAIKAKVNEFLAAARTAGHLTP